ncbi:guanine nucleotide exchange factor DBS-like isoform X4 [Acropora muricata]
MPEHPKFGSLSDRDAELIFRYLIGLGRKDLLYRGFVLVLDRRTETWGAVKSCLNKVQKCFPAKISLVCLIIPQGFSQTYSKPGFVTDGIIGDAKIQVVSLNSVAELEGYIEKSQLTEEVGGTLDYRHNEWVQHRSEIESFQRNLQASRDKIEELHQGFTRTRLPPSVQEIEHILESQEEMWHDVKEDIENSRQDGVTSLECITGHRGNKENTERVLTPDVKANAAELKQALTELESLENNFEKFWKSHKLKIQHRLKVCFFEQKMSQELLEKEKSLIAKGTKSMMMESNKQSKDQIQVKCDKTRELCDKFEREVQNREEDLKKAMDIHECLEMVNKWGKTGRDLLATQPIDRFQSSEGAEKGLEEIENFLKSPQGMNMAKVTEMTPMSSALGNKTLIGKVKDSQKRMSEVKEMLEKRETSLKKLVVKRPVQPVSGIPANPPKQEEIKRKHSITPKSPSTPKSPVIVYKERKKSISAESTGKRPVSIVLEPDSFQKSGGVQQSLSEPSMQTRDVVDGTNSPEAHKKREEVMTKLIETEKDYVDDLECIINGYIKEFEQAGKKIPAELHGKKKVVFGNIEQIYRFHRNEFLCELEANKDQPSQVGGLFFTKSTEFEMYATYCKNQPSSDAFRMHYINLPFFKECQDKLGHKLPLSAYLLKPVQRITKYQLLIREMMKLTVKNSTAFDDLEKALETLEGVLRHVNDVMHSCGIKGFRGNLAEQGKLLLQDTFMVWETNRNWNLNFLRSKGGRQHQVFMYQKMIIFSQKDDDPSRGSATYLYKKHIKTCDMAFRETVQGDPLKFELSLMERSEVFFMQPSSKAVKNRWVKEITNLMWLQFAEVKEAVATEQTGLHSLWRSASMLSSATKSSENGLCSRSQSSLMLKTQYELQVHFFGREMSQTTGLLHSAVDNLSAMVDFGDSRDDAESLLEDLKEFSEKSVELLEKAKSLIAKGTTMMESNEQSKDQIQVKCDETRELCNKFEREVQKREEDLKKAMDIHECLEMVNKWCKTGVDLLATQPIDRFQSSEGAEKGLEEIENFLKSPQGMNMAKVTEMTPMSSALGNKTLIGKVKDSQKRMSEVKEMLEKRETSLKKLVVKRPVQPVSGIPANPPKQEEIKRKHSVTPKSPSTPKSPVIAFKERKKSIAAESSGKRPVSIALEPDSFQKSGGVQQSFSEPSLQTRDVVDGTNGPEAHKKREQVMTELIETEKGYVDDLECIINGYIKEFEQAGNKIPAELHGKKTVIFGNIGQIYRFHRNEFLCELEANKDQPSQVGGLFLTKSTEFEMYVTYCKNQPNSEALDYSNLPFFKECQDKLGHKLPLSAYLLKPVQRITKYQLLIREMMKLTVKNSTAFDDLEKALETMEGVLRHVNDVMHSCGLKGFRGNLAEQGKLLLQDTFMVWETNRNWNLNFLRSKGGRRHQVFMYQKMIIFSQKDDDTSRGSATYQYKKHIKTCDMAFTENVQGDSPKFELSLTGRSEVFVMQPSSTAVKNRWAKEIRNLMWLQFGEVKEAVSTEQTGLHSNGLCSRGQSPLSVVGPNIVGDSNRVSNIQEFDDDEGWDTDEWDSSDSSDDCATQQ